MSSHRHFAWRHHFFHCCRALSPLLPFASPQAAETGKPEDTERRVGGRSGATRDGNRKTHRGLQGKQEGLLGHYFSPSAPHRPTNSNSRVLTPSRRLCPQPPR